jgi:NodT family efflux transporter outer membrane factor (OMF) lipoprotein
MISELVMRGERFRGAGLLVTLFFLGAAPVFVGGCVGDRNWQGARLVSPDTLIADRALSAAQVSADAWPADTWWQGYGDPQLNALIGEALAGSPTLQMAQARLRAAQAEATRASGPRLPGTALDAETTRQRYSQNGVYPAPFAGNYFSDGRLALDFSYDLDFWGHNRDVLQSARAGVHAAEADQAAARLALTVALARAYFQLDLQYALLDIARESLEQQSSILDLTRQRAATGLENIARVKQSEANVALTRAGVDYTEAGIRLIRAQLGALAGSGPDRGADLKRPQLSAPEKTQLPSTLPAELLGRRPDIAAQRWRVESATHGVAAAEAAFYPNVNLAAFAGFQAIGLAKLLDGGSAIVGVGPALSLPLFNRRELHGALQVQQAQYDLSVAQYNQAVIDAVNDVANVVTNWDALVKEADEARVAEDAANGAYAITKDRYRAGLDNYLSVLSAESEVFTTQALRAELLTRALNLTTDLVRALGGGYTTTALGTVSATAPGN